MKTHLKIIILVATLLLACVLIMLSFNPNDSFEDYNDWCNEIVIKEKIVFDFDITNKQVDTVQWYAIDGYTHFRIRPNNISYKREYTLSNLKEYINDDRFNIENLSCEIEFYREERDTPTFEGYNEWLKEKR